MKLLLDTHVLLWAVGAPHRLPTAVYNDLTNPENDVLFSAVSIWEVAIKASLGRADFIIDAALIAQEACSAGFAELPVTAQHAAAVQALPLRMFNPNPP